MRSRYHRLVFYTGIHRSLLTLYKSVALQSDTPHELPHEYLHTLSLSACGARNDCPAKVAVEPVHRLRSALYLPLAIVSCL